MVSPASAVNAQRVLTLPYAVIVERVLLPSGANVTRGQALLEVRAAPANPTASPTQSRRDAAFAAAEHARVQRLHADGLATTAELLAAANADAAAREQVRLLEAGGASAATTAGGLQVLRAPMAGVVELSVIDVGAAVAPTSVLARITQRDQLLLRVGLEASDLQRLEPGSAALISTLDSPMRSGEATLAAIDARVDPVTRLAAAMLRVPAAMGLLPGESARVKFTSAEHLATPSVPRAAVLYADDAAYVYLAGGRNNRTARRVDVVLGLQGDDYFEIAHGLALGQLVIVMGNAEVEDGIAIRTAGAGKP